MVGMQLRACTHRSQGNLPIICILMERAVLWLSDLIFRMMIWHLASMYLVFFRSRSFWALSRWSRMSDCKICIQPSSSCRERDTGMVRNLHHNLTRSYKYNRKWRYRKSPQYHHIIYNQLCPKPSHHLLTKQSALKAKLWNNAVNIYCSVQLDNCGTQQF